MSSESMPAALSVSISAFMSALLASSASLAVAPCEVTPDVTNAVSGVAMISPWPVICMEPAANTGVERAVARVRGIRAARIRIGLSLDTAGYHAGECGYDCDAG